MDLILWRHAEAVLERPDRDDLERALTPKGERQAQRMAEWLNQRLAHSTRILVSPALRCQQTARALGLPFETDRRLDTDGDVASLLATIGWPDGADHLPAPDAVLVVGHQPTLGQAAALLLAGAEAPWTIKKGALWWFSNRTRQGETQTVLRAAIPVEFV